jgi:hypothetical protein
MVRLSPSVPHTGRFALEDDVMPDGTRVKAGDHVRYVQYYLHRNPRYWDQPDEFLPGRECHAFVCLLICRAMGKQEYPTDTISVYAFPCRTNAMYDSSTGSIYLFLFCFIIPFHDMLIN